MSRTVLVAQLGQPTERLSSNVWVYADFRAPHRPAHERYDALLVVFTGERVTRLRLVQSAAVVPALAKFRAANAKAAAVAFKLPGTLCGVRLSSCLAKAGGAGGHRGWGRRARSSSFASLPFSRERTS
jgi:hypothetical protein